jgi:hypothetical protein
MGKGSSRTSSRGGQKRRRSGSRKSKRHRRRSRSPSRSPSPSAAAAASPSAGRKLLKHAALGKLRRLREVLAAQADATAFVNSVANADGATALHQVCV